MRTPNSGAKRQRSGRIEVSTTGSRAKVFEAPGDRKWLASRMIRGGATARTCPSPTVSIVFVERDYSLGRSRKLRSGARRRRCLEVEGIAGGLLTACACVPVGRRNE